MKVSRNTFVLFAIWLVATAINLGKAAHIDDTAHLQIADWIAEHPTHPMRGLVYWGEDYEPIHHLNQPHLFYYLLAAVRALPLPREMSGQLLVSLFTGLALWAFQSLWRRVVGERLLGVASALLFLGPAFVPGQNVMTDVPLLALWLVFAALLFPMDAKFDASSSRAWGAAGVLSAALLVKYTTLALLPVFAWHQLRQRTSRAAAPLLVPIGVLSLWSLFNLWDYGGIHLAGRSLAVAQFSLLEATGIAFGRAALWIVGLGAAVPFFFFGIARRFGVRSKTTIAVALVVVVLTAATQIVALYVDALRGESWLMSMQRASFFVLGTFVFSLCLRRDDQTVEAVEKFLRGWILATSLFVVVLSPFVAMRHILLIVPPLMLLAARRIDLAALPRTIVALALFVQTGLGVTLGVSDRLWANAWRELAHHAPHDAWFLGHWGWQWYATARGLRPFVPARSALRAGETLWVPRIVDAPAIPEETRLRLRHVETVLLPNNIFTTVRTITERPGYYALWQGLPYLLSFSPLAEVDVYEVLDRADARATTRTP